MVITRQIEEECLNINWVGKRLEQVETFEHPGTVIIVDGKSDEEINYWLQKVNQIYFLISVLKPEQLLI